LKILLSDNGDGIVNGAKREEISTHYHCWASNKAQSLTQHDLLLAPWSRNTTMLDNLLLVCCQEGQNEDEETLFTFRRVAYLASPWPYATNNEHKDAFQSSGAIGPAEAAAASASYYNHATVILYNLATCLQLVPFEKRYAADHLSTVTNAESKKKALRLYRMAFATMQLSGQQQQCPISTMLHIVLLNNSGKLMYLQGNTCEAANCFRKVRELLRVNEQVVASWCHPVDFSGLCLNSYIDIQTASAA
jgi:hypothetical protein